MNKFDFKISPGIVPVLDPDFKPASLGIKAFKKAVSNTGKGIPLAIALERGGGLISNYNLDIFDGNAEMDEANNFIVERIIKTLLWARGGWKVTIGGSKKVGEYIKKAYSDDGMRAFDAKFMSNVYEKKEFVVEITEYDNVPATKEDTKPVGRNLDGCRIGFDAGGSDRKVSAVIDGEVVYSEEVIWHPKIQTDPDYHYSEILSAMKSAASHMPKVDAIGVSSAGIYVNNRTMVASLFLKVPEELFDKKVKDIYINVAKEMGDVPLEVANDGDVTALAGAMDLNDNNILGLAMGTSEAGGYVDSRGNITGWLNELAFIPVDFNPEAMVDEWSGDYGCGVKYFSQDGVIKLAPAAGIELDAELTPAEKLKAVQNLLDKKDSGAVKIFESIGTYLGYAMAYYAEFYDIKHALILGRVTSGEAGDIILEKAYEVLNKEFPEIAKKVNMILPDESNKRVGQSIAAASLPKIK
ncbi:MAG: ROK family protein [Clostridia bacterium]|jgi:predicted NBD/HSP70 family sugar kinase